jgi:molybdopterin synthase sulfur carrier subunit
MPVVRLRAPLKDLVGGNAELVLEGATVGEVLRALETSWPRTAGWILDEQGSVRRHVNVFVGDRQVREDAAVGPQDRLVVLPSITGGALGA